MEKAHLLSTPNLANFASCLCPLALALAMALPFAGHLLLALLKRSACCWPGPLSYGAAGLSLANCLTSMRAYRFSLSFRLLFLVIFCLHLANIYDFDLNLILCADDTIDFYLGTLRTCLAHGAYGIFTTLRGELHNCCIEMAL